jgi:hypothetical protein
MPIFELNLIRNRGLHQEEKLTKLRKLFVALTISLALVGMSAGASAQSDSSLKGALEGTWNAILIADEGGFQEAERYNFSAGRTANEGSLIFSNEVDAVPPCGTDQGIWVRTGSRQFTLTHGAFCVDLATASPAFRIKFREVITLNARDDQFTGRGVFEVFDTGGGLLFSAAYAVRGVRMQAEGLARPVGLDAPDALPQSESPAREQSSAWRRWMKNLQQ